MKMIDHLRIAGLNLPPMPVIVADEVARQIDLLPDRLDYSPPASAYGIVAPPFESFFVEATTKFKNAFLTRGAHIRLIEPPYAPEDARWTMGLSGYMRLPDGRLFSYGATVLLNISAEGYVLDDTNALNVMLTPSEGVGERLDPGGAAGHVPYALKAIAAMHLHCPVEHVTPSRQERRMAQRKHGRELSDYYVLKVKPAQPSEFGSVGREGTATERRQHVVRGHFRYYTPERPLFGHTAGMVWVDDHKRGSEGKGRIDKDYKI